MMKRIWIFWVAAAALCGATATDAANWPKWRGPDDSGSTTEGSYPTRIDPEKPRWKAALPGKGCSTPVVWNRKIILTAPIEGADGVLAYDWDGKLLWQTKLGPESSGKHRNGSGSNPSPVTDGESVFVYFKSGTLAALDLTGKVRWQTNLVAGFGPETLYWDQGTSPVLTRQDVVIARMHEGESWLAAFDKATGKLHWKTARNYETAVEGDHGYATPLVFEHEGREALLAWGGEHVTAHETGTGKLLWECGDFNPQKVANWPTVASPVIVGQTAIVPFGRADRTQPRLHGVKLGGSGKVTATHRVWDRTDTGSFVPTPAVYKGTVYVLRDRGEVYAIDPKTGENRWTDAIPKASQNFYASPLIANGILYAIREDGAMFITRVEPKFELLSECKLGDRVIASPVALDSRLLIRGDKNLLCFSE